MKPGGRLTRKPWPVTAEQVQRWNTTQREARQRYAAKPRTQQSRAGESRARRLVYARSGGWCEARIPGICLGNGESWHHRIKRSQGGLWLPSNGLHTCGDGSRGCHGALTNTGGRRAEYRRLGLVLDRGDNPPAEPVVCIHGRVLLDDHGDWTAAEETTTSPRGTSAA